MMVQHTHTQISRAHKSVDRLVIAREEKISFTFTLDRDRSRSAAVAFCLVLSGITESSADQRRRAYSNCAHSVWRNGNSYCALAFSSFRNLRTVYMYMVSTVYNTMNGTLRWKRNVQLGFLL